MAIERQVESVGYLKSLEIKHGQHDQSSHGRRGGRGGGNQSSVSNHPLAKQEPRIKKYFDKLVDSNRKIEGDPDGRVYDTFERSEGTKDKEMIQQMSVYKTKKNEYYAVIRGGNPGSTSTWHNTFRDNDGYSKSARIAASLALDGVEKRGFLEPLDKPMSYYHSGGPFD